MKTPTPDSGPSLEDSPSLNLLSTPLHNMTSEQLGDHVARLREILSRPAQNRNNLTNETNHVECLTCSQVLRIPDVAGGTKVKCPKCESIFYTKEAVPKDRPIIDHTTASPAIPNAPEFTYSNPQNSEEIRQQKATNNGLMSIVLTLVYFIVGMMLGSSKEAAFEGAASVSASFMGFAGLISLPFFGVAERKNIGMSKVYFGAWLTSVILFFIFRK